jgi:hypothetical protein
MVGRGGTSLHGVPCTKVLRSFAMVNIFDPKAGDFTGNFVNECNGLLTTPISVLTTDPHLARLAIGCHLNFRISPVMPASPVAINPSVPGSGTGGVGDPALNSPSVNKYPPGESPSGGM